MSLKASFDLMSCMFLAVAVDHMVKAVVFGSDDMGINEDFHFCSPYIEQMK
jgi:hypothetical protein